MIRLIISIAMMALIAAVVTLVSRGGSEEAGDCVKVCLRAWQERDALYVELTNNSGDSIDVNSVFNIGYRETSISMDFRGVGATEIPASRSHASSVVLNPEETRITLRPDSFYGARLDVEEIFEYYEIQAGCYEVGVQYASGGALKVPTAQVRLCSSY